MGDVLNFLFRLCICEYNIEDYQGTAGHCIASQSGSFKEGAAIAKGREGEHSELILEFYVFSQVSHHEQPFWL